MLLTGYEFFRLQIMTKDTGAVSLPRCGLISISLPATHPLLQQGYALQAVPEVKVTRSASLDIAFCRISKMNNTHMPLLLLIIHLNQTSNHNLMKMTA